MCRAIFTLLDRVDRVALGQYRGVVRVDLSHPVIAERSIGHIPMSGNEQVDHVLRPALAVLFVDQRQLPQVMRIAQAVAAVIFPVGCPAIMDGGPLESRQNPESVESLLATVARVCVAAVCSQ